MATIVPSTDDSTNAESLNDLSKFTPDSEKHKSDGVTEVVGGIKSDHGGQVTLQALDVDTANNEPINRGDRLAANQELKHNEQLTSPNGLYQLVLVNNGNLILYGPKGQIWATGTWATDAWRAFLLPNGDFQLLAASHNRVVWNTKSFTDPRYNPVLILQDNGDVVITTSDNRVIWSNNTHRFIPKTKPDRLEVGQGFYSDDGLTSPNGKYRLSMDRGDLYLFGGKEIIWSAKNPPTADDRTWLELRSGAKLVLCNFGWDRWSAPLWVPGGASSVLILDDDGNLSLISDGLLVWSPTKRDCLYRDNKISIGQVLKAGDYRLSFDASGKTGLIQVTNDRTGQTIWYYSEERFIDEPARYVQFTKAAALCFKDRNDNTLGMIIPRLRNLIPIPDEYNMKTRFTFGSDGWGRIYLEGREEWSFNDLARGPTPTPPPYNNIMRKGTTFYRGMGIFSSNTQYWFGLYPDGSVSLINLIGDRKIIWTAPGNVRGDTLMLQDDGNLVLYSGGKAQWASNTVLRNWDGRIEVVMQNDRNVVLYAVPFKKWETDTSPFFRWGDEN